MAAQAIVLVIRGHGPLRFGPFIGGPAPSVAEARPRAELARAVLHHDETGNQIARVARRAGAKRFGAGGEDVLYQHGAVWKAPTPQIRIDVLTRAVDDMKLLVAVSRRQQGIDPELPPLLALINLLNVQDSLCCCRL